MDARRHGNRYCPAIVDLEHRDKLLDVGLAQTIQVDIERGEVHIEGNPEWREHAAKVLAGIGYPESGSVEGMQAAAARAAAASTMP